MTAISQDITKDEFRKLCKKVSEKLIEFSS